jgi:hypothetical protein
VTTTLATTGPAARRASATPSGGPAQLPATGWAAVGRAVVIPGGGDGHGWAAVGRAVVTPGGGDGHGWVAVRRAVVIPGGGDSHGWAEVPGGPVVVGFEDGAWLVGRL